jgi:pimeloyl-ACP methyl ester carboxylesterase
VVGHDWGAAVAWLTAILCPDRVRTLTSISVPHPLSPPTLRQY